MNHRALVALCGLGLALLTPAAAAPDSQTFPLRYRWTAGQTHRYLIQCDPYFANPAQAIETTDPKASYRPPRVERLTEQVLAVGTDGTATLRLTLTPEPGFEDSVHPQPPVTQTVTVTPWGQRVGGSEALAPEMLAVIFRLPADAAETRGTLAFFSEDGPPDITQNKTPGHDGLLLQTTRSRRRDQVVFDVRAGRLVRRTGTITGSLSLEMIRPAKRGADDFGHVVPSLTLLQTLIIERKEDPVSIPAPPYFLRRDDLLPAPGVEALLKLYGKNNG